MEFQVNNQQFYSNFYTFFREFSKKKKLIFQLKETQQNK